MFESTVHDHVNNNISNNHNDLSTDLSSSLTERHLKIWNKFFENAMKVTDSKSNLNNSGNQSSNSKSSNKSYSNSSYISNNSYYKWPKIINSIKYNTFIQNIIISKLTVNESNQLLILSSIQSDNETIEKLLIHGININYCDKYKRNSVHYCTFNNNVLGLAILLDYGADIDSSDIFLMTPLHISCYFCNCNSLLFLLESACNCNCTDVNGNNPIHILLLNDNNNPVTDIEICCNYLVEYNINLTHKNNDNLTPIDIANNLPNNENILNILNQTKKKRKKTNNPLRTSISSHSTKSNDVETISSSLSQSGLLDFRPAWLDLKVDTSVGKSKDNNIEILYNNNDSNYYEVVNLEVDGYNYEQNYEKSNDRPNSHNDNIINEMYNNHYENASNNMTDDEFLLDNYNYDERTSQLKVENSYDQQPIQNTTYNFYYDSNIENNRIDNRNNDSNIDNIETYNNEFNTDNIADNTNYYDITPNIDTNGTDSYNEFNNFDRTIDYDNNYDLLTTEINPYDNKYNYNYESYNVDQSSEPNIMSAEYDNINDYQSYAENHINIVNDHNFESKNDSITYDNYNTITQNEFSYQPNDRYVNESIYYPSSYSASKDKEDRYVNSNKSIIDDSPYSKYSSINHDSSKSKNTYQLNRNERYKPNSSKINEDLNDSSKILMRPTEFNNKITENYIHVNDSQQTYNQVINSVDKRDNDMDIDEDYEDDEVVDKADISNYVLINYIVKVSDLISFTVWGFASILLTTILSMFQKANHNSIINSNNKIVKFSIFNKFISNSGDSNNPNYTDINDTTQDISPTNSDKLFWTNKDAPPTDKELSQLGLGMTFQPPDMIVNDINNQIIALKTGLTPRNTKPIEPPKDIQNAVFYAKVEADRIRNTPRNSISKYDRDHDNEKLNPYLLTPSSVTRGYSQLLHTNSSSKGIPKPLFSKSVNQNPIANSYSMGNSIPNGVTWRYVDVLNNPDLLHGTR